MIVVTELYLGMNDENQEQIMFAQTTLNKKKIHDRNDYDKDGYHNDDKDNEIMMKEVMMIKIKLLMTISVINNQSVYHLTN